LQDGPKVTFLGTGDLHDSSYNNNKLSSSLVDTINQYLKEQDINNEMSSFENSDSFSSPCSNYTIAIYPSQDTENYYTSSGPMMITIWAAWVFGVIILTFLLYVRWMESREDKLRAVAKQSSAIVSSLFPSVVRDRLLGNNTATKTEDRPLLDNNMPNTKHQPTKQRLKTFLHTGLSGMNETMLSNGEVNSATNNGGGINVIATAGAKALASSSQPIADLFLETTVLFADIAGFTAWCSVREPTQVFILLGKFFCIIVYFELYTFYVVYSFKNSVYNLLRVPVWCL
jgi:hypothetical protein